MKAQSIPKIKKTQLDAHARESQSLLEYLREKISEVKAFYNFSLKKKSLKFNQISSLFKKIASFEEQLGKLYTEMISNLTKLKELLQKIYEYKFKQLTSQAKLKVLTIYDSSLAVMMQYYLSWVLRLYRIQCTLDQNCSILKNLMITLIPETLFLVHGGGVQVKSNDNGTTETNGLKGDEVKIELSKISGEFKSIIDQLLEIIREGWIFKSKLLYESIKQSIYLFTYYSFESLSSFQSWVLNEKISSETQKANSLVANISSSNKKLRLNFLLFNRLREQIRVLKRLAEGLKSRLLPF